MVIRLPEGDRIIVGTGPRTMMSSPSGTSGLPGASPSAATSAQPPALIRRAAATYPRMSRPKRRHSFAFLRDADNAASPGSAVRAPSRDAAAEEEIATD